ncbi:YolD-like family protein [Peribacillus muralis]|uniref:YolD-like family protein n=1 Tax=Peribacillus muralis TaxID=264697 RepID=UPI003D04ACF8
MKLEIVPSFLPAPFHTIHFIRTIVPFQVVLEQMFGYNIGKGDGRMIKDRGNIKWQSSLMLPEHVKLLRGWAEEDKIQPKPILDEQELDLISTIAMDSLHNTFVVKIVYWKDGLFTYKKGIVESVHMINRVISVELLNGKITIPFDCITSIERD